MKIRSLFLIRLSARLLATLFRVLFWTCRVRVIAKTAGVSPYDTPGAERFIYCNWHDGILGAAFCRRVRSTAALTSRHMDGEFVAELIRAVGIHPIRGSSSQGGAAAVGTMLRVARDHHVTIATDGPRGPRRVVKPGVVFLASHAGRRIVPTAFAAANAWRPRGRWTDLVIPKPFSTVYAIGGEPMDIPPGLRRDQLQPYRDELQRRIDALNSEADELAGVKTANEWPALARRKAA